METIHCGSQLIPDQQKTLENCTQGFLGATAAVSTKKINRFAWKVQINDVDRSTWTRNLAAIHRRYRKVKCNPRTNMINCSNGRRLFTQNLNIPSSSVSELSSYKTILAKIIICLPSEGQLTVHYPVSRSVTILSGIKVGHNLQME